VERADDLSLADVVILPGTKQTLDDLEWLVRNNFPARILEHYSRRAPIVGVCGGFQMLGLKLSDPRGAENDGVRGERDGLGLLSVQTVFSAEKTVRPVSGQLCDVSFAAGLWRAPDFRGYEIHMGETYRTGETQPFARISALDGVHLLDGAISPNGLVFGSYVHGIFDNDLFRHSFLDWARSSLELATAQQKAFVTAERDARMNRWADHLRRSLRLDLIRSWTSPARTAVEMVKK
jgi:adenosylcobyric acid synthase